MQARRCEDFHTHLYVACACTWKPEHGDGKSCTHTHQCQPDNISHKDRPIATYTQKLQFSNRSSTAFICTIPQEVELARQPCHPQGTTHHGFNTSAKSCKSLLSHGNFQGSQKGSTVPNRSSRKTLLTKPLLRANLGAEGLVIC